MKTRCNLMSWTNSLFFALQYSLYRHKTDCDEVDRSQVLLFVLDTRDFQRGTFVENVEIINVFASHPDGSELKNFNGRARYFGEYLTQGRSKISGKSSITNMQSLINAGLFKLEPRLEDSSKWEKLANTIVCLREPFKYSARCSWGSS